MAKRMHVLATLSALLGAPAAAQVGTVDSEVKISETAGGFGGVLDSVDQFGLTITTLGDLDGDGVTDLAVGANRDDDGGTDQGAVWILFLEADGTVKSEQKISELFGSFAGPLDAGDFFGQSVAFLGDLDGNGTRELAVGAVLDDDGGTDQGAVWILSLAADGTVAASHKISETAGGFTGVLDPFDEFGIAVESLPDLDGDGIRELAVGARKDDDGGTAQGALWILFLNADGTVKSEQKISELFGGFGGVLDTGDQFGQPPFFIGDFDGDGIDELAVGAPADDDGGSNQGAVWILFLEGDLGPPTISCPPVVTAIDPFKGPTGEVVFFSVPATDDSDPAPSVVCVPPSGSLFPPGTTIVTCTATDAAGNQATCQFPVVVVPMLRPGQL